MVIAGAGNWILQSSGREASVLNRQPISPAPTYHLMYMNVGCVLFCFLRLIFIFVHVYIYVLEFILVKRDTITTATLIRENILIGTGLQF